MKNPDGTHTFDPGWEEHAKHIPPGTLDNIKAYVEKRRSPSNSLRAILYNDLTGAILYADSDNLAAMRHIVALLFHHCPYGCWGTKKRVQEWLAGRKS